MKALTDIVRRCISQNIRGVCLPGYGRCFLVLSFDSIVVPCFLWSLSPGVRLMSVACILVRVHSLSPLFSCLSCGACLPMGWVLIYHCIDKGFPDASHESAVLGASSFGAMCVNTYVM